MFSTQRNQVLIFKVGAWDIEKGRIGYKSTESVNYMSFSTLKLGDYFLFFYLFEQEARGKFSEKLTEDHRIYRIPRITEGLD